MRKLPLCLCLTVMFAFQQGRASTATNVSCGTPGAPLAVGTNSCYTPGIGGYSQANVSASVILPGSPSDAALISASSIVSALQTGIRGISTTASATSSADISILFSTSGPARNGFLELTLEQIAWVAPVNGLVSESLSVSSFSINPGGFGTQTIWLPLQLGMPFGFDYKQSITALGSSLSGLTSGQLGIQIGLLAFESDRLTATQLFDPPAFVNQPLVTPEPASAGLIVTACLVAGAMFFKRRR